MATSADFLIDGLSPQEVSTSPSTDTLYWVLPRRWPESSLMILSPNEDCRVFVLRCQSTSHLTGPILSHQVIYSHQVLQIQMSYMQTYIHTFMHISIHPYTIGTQISFIHNCINHPESLLLTISQKCHLPACRITRRHSSFFMSRVSSPGLSNYETSLKFLYVKSIISRLVGLRDVTQVYL